MVGFSEKSEDNTDFYVEHLTFKKKQDHATSLMRRGHQFQMILRETQLIFHHWMLELADLGLS